MKPSAVRVDTCVVTPDSRDASKDFQIPREDCRRLWDEAKIGYSVDTRGYVLVAGGATLAELKALEVPRDKARNTAPWLR